MFLYLNLAAGNYCKMIKGFKDYPRLHGKRGEDEFYAFKNNV